MLFCLALTLLATACSDNVVEPDMGVGPAAAALSGSTTDLREVAGSGAAVSLVSMLDSSKCMDVYGAKSVKGAKLVSWSCHGKENQEFVWNANGEIRSGDLCVDAYGARGQNFDPIVLWTCNGGTYQRWSGTASGEIRGINGKCIDITNASTTNGAALILYTCHGDANQKWQARAAGSGSIDPVAPKLPALDVPAQCSDYEYSRLVKVSTSSQLSDALRYARAGDLILLADGTYTGRRTITASGTADEPIILCGTSAAVLADTRYDGGAVLLLKNANRWVLHGFTVQNALWGIRLERSSHNQLRNLTVRDVGQEAIGIKLFSSHNVVQGSRIRDTGRRGWSYTGYGEGIYVGSWSGHWTDGQPDRSDHNQIVDNEFGPNITAEHIDIKEGTTGGVIRGNRFDGRGMENNGAAVDSWVLVQGNDYVIEQNNGKYSRRNGFRAWPGPGWGQRNVFRNNVADVQASGYGFVFQGTMPGTVVMCNNTVTNAGSGFANVKCTN
jgi:hypothetical protein